MTSLFSKPKTPDVNIPPPPPVVPMADTGDILGREKRKRATATLGQQRSGRQSTILSDRGGSDLLGG